MKIFKIIILLLIGIIILFLMSVVIVSHFRKNSINYQMSKLKNGNTAQIIFAANFMGDHKIIESVPLLIKNIDNEDRYFWDKEPKGGRINVSCVITYALNQITSLNFEDTCYKYDLKEKNNDSIKQYWKDWFKNDYENWLKGQTNNK